MASSPLHVVEIKLIGANHLQNVNWRHGTLLPYAAVWTNPSCKCFTLVDPVSGSSPFWNQTLLVLLPPGAAVEEALLHIHVMHAGFEDGPNPLIGSAQLSLRDVLEDDGGSGGRANRRTLQLKRPSGRPQGTVDIELAVKEMRYSVPSAANVVPPPLSSGQEEDSALASGDTSDDGDPMEIDFAYEDNDDDDS